MYLLKETKTKKIYHFPSLNRYQMKQMASSSEPILLVRIGYERQSFV